MAEEGGVTVCVRVRPLIERENADLDERGQILWKSEGCTISQFDGTKSFTFDQVFHSADSTTEVYKGVAAPIIQSAVQGYNGTIFAYGQTASGKTYTMLGTKDCPGILPMAINDVFNTICRIPDREFLLRISYMEIHNETIQDLLCSDIRKKKPLVVREDINRTIYVEDLSEEVVVSPEQVLSWLKKGEKNRHYGETKMNERSSRSHTIFRMIIESKEKTETSSSNYEGAVMVSHLNLVDLAGSERASQTGAEGIRLKEGCNINRSLFILGQVIKKLCDDQSGGYINYRDSKLTRILQNSLGGNAKTVIICTVTPVSLEETLSTLQFASTAKKMKNSPKVNEVLDDDALLKRYRKEIEDLKRRLEEVSSHSQLTQILEEKNSLQKEQQEKIRSLTEMLVTASSFAQGQELKVRRKRRVTWAPGSLEGGDCFLEDFPTRPKHFKASLSSLTEMEESVSSEFSEYDDQYIIASAIIPEEEWIPASKAGLTHKDFADSVVLCESLAEERDNAVTEQKAMTAKVENLQVEKEQMACEIRELKEKISTDEFVLLEKETAKEQEMQLMHEISSLKSVITNAEVYNQDLQEEIKSKDLQLKEQENKIKVLEDHVNELRNIVKESKMEDGKRGVSSITSNNSLDEMQQMKQSLIDAEAVALDAKRESSFLRSENVALKEEMEQLSNIYNQMEKDVECYRSQLDARKVTYKKMQSDLQKELQYYLQENAKLASLLEGRVPKELLSCVELERKISDLKDELNKALEENATLRKEATASLEAGSGSDPEIFEKEMLEKSKMIASLTSERETLLSQVAEKDKTLCEVTTALQSKDLENAEAMHKNDFAFQELKLQCNELGQKFLIASEENKGMKSQVDVLSDENLKLNATIHEMTQELSGKIKELEEKDLEQEKFLDMKKQLDEAHQKLSETEQLKDQLKAWASKMEAEETEKQTIAQRLQDSEEEIRALTQERDDLKQKQEALKQERDQFKEDIQETVSMNIESQEELRNAHNSLKQRQKQIKELEETIVAKESQISHVEALGITIEEQKQQILKLTEDLEHFSMTKNLLTEGDSEEIMLEENNKLRLMKEQIFSLEREKTVLQQQLNSLQEEKNWFLESNQLLSSKIQELQTGITEQDGPCMKEQLCQALEKLSEMEQLRGQLKASASRIEEVVMDKMTIAQKLQGHEKAMKALIQERDDLRERLDALQVERGRIKERIEGETAQKLHEHEEAMRTLTQERDDLKERWDAVQMERDHIKEETEADLAQKLHEHEEAMRTLIQERDDLRARLDALQMERDLIKEGIEREVAQKLHEHEEAMRALTQERDNLKDRWDAVQMERDHIKEETEADLAQKLHDLEEAMRTLIQERDDLRARLDALQMERDLIKEGIEGEVSQKLHEHDEAMRALTQERDDLKERWDAVQMERDHIKEETEADIAQKLHEHEEAMRTLIQERDDLRARLDALQMERDLIKEGIEGEVAQKLHEHEEAMSALTQERDNLKDRWDAVQMERDHIKEETVAQKLRDLEEAMRTLIQERDDLRARLDALQMERDLIKEGIEGEVSQKLHEHDEAMRALTQERDDLKERWDAVQMERDHIKEETEADLAQKLHEHEEVMRTLTQERDDLKERWDAVQMERDHIKEETEADLAQKLHEHEEAMRTLIQERDDLRARLDALQMERDLIKEGIEGETAQKLHEHEEAMRALTQERDNLKDRWDAVQMERDHIKEETEADLTQKLHDLEEAMRTLIQERDDLRARLDALQMERDLIKEGIEGETAQKLHEHDEAMRALTQERDDLKERWDAVQMERDHIKEETEADLAQKLHEHEEAMRTLIQERDDLRARLDALQMERDLIKEETEADLAQKRHELEEAMRILIQERDDLRARLDAVQVERDHIKEQMQTTESMLSLKLQDKERVLEELFGLKEQQNRLVMEQLGEDLKARESELEAQKIEKVEMARRLWESKEESKSLTLEKDGLKQKSEALQKEREDLKKFLEETTSKIQHLEQKSLDLQQMLELREEQNQKDAEWLNEMKLLKVTAESKMEAMGREKAELLQKLHSAAENLRSVTQEKENLKTMALELQEQLGHCSRHNKGDSEMAEEPEGRIVGKGSQTSELQEMSDQGTDQQKREEILKKFLVLEKRSEYLKTISLNLKTELDSQKVLVAKWLVDLPPEQANNIETLQMEHGYISNCLHSLLNKWQFLFARLCKKKGEYYSNFGRYTTELLDEKRKQLELLTQIQCLKPHSGQRGAVSEQLNIPELSRNLEFYEEQILKDVSEMEEELLSIEVKLQHLGSDGVKAKQYLQRCSVHFDIKDFQAGIKQDNERLLPVGQFLKPKSQALIHSKSELEMKNANYCRETGAALKQCREHTKELLLELNTLQEEQTRCGAANFALEEENYKLGNKLKAIEQELKDINLKKQELENATSEAKRNLQEKEKRIAMLEMELKVRTSRSEVVQLQATLGKKEDCLRTALMEQLTLKAKLDKGAELYKEEIEDLKTQLAKADMARMKRSKYFDQELANAKALAEHREEQLRKLKEELRKVQQEQDVTVIASRKGHSQSSLPITCGGGSGIVQSTHMLVVKTEHATLEREYAQLKKQFELVLKNELILKEEVKKWKEQALKRREQSSREISEEHRLKSPKKTAPPSFSELPPSPCKKRSLQRILPLDSPAPVPLTYPSFFDNSQLALTDSRSLGAQSTDTKSAGAESTENNLKHWIATAKKDGVSDCKTQ
ncbi:centromere-associated protein E isoform X2 [Rhineura floridana]|uniref:centromere-associated protein E isoform X2 n=1 Tax=Rhineura floridana TaxID=261503 RepID=UPI002AC85506|nr:centromere-associated protein E isoform X2 [Rhineura floridana]